MTEQQWNFAGIEAAASAIQGNVTSIHSLLDEGKQSLTKLAAAWGGSGSRRTRVSSKNGTPRLPS